MFISSKKGLSISTPMVKEEYRIYPWDWIVCFLVTILALSNMVWKIDIKGANPETEHQMRKHLDDIRVQKGRFQFLMGTPEKKFKNP
ncbi:hypothetical protein BsIDN1_44300 [Bacillus safensis]|uniref:Uncharacterized protein n=1 Tax=Bacillus safensis TaxID=561879 RepID=A0A5S9MDZ6_BACIA|nr:hypothetical protein BsIDN1_44300 [Bacillus safensis]